MAVKTLASLKNERNTNIVQLPTCRKSVQVPLKGFTMTKTLQQMEQDGTINRVERLIAASHLLAKCSDLLFMESQDILIDGGVCHREIKQAYNKWEASIKQVDLAYKSMFRKAREEHPGEFMAEFERLFPRIAKLIGVYDIAGQLAGPKEDQEVTFPKDRGPKERCSIEIPQWDKQRLKEIAKQHHITLSEMLRKSLESFILNNPIKVERKYKTV